MTHPSEAKTFDEIEEELGAGGGASNLIQTKLEGAGVPAELKGKTAAELGEEARKLKEALIISEQARQAGEGQRGRLEAENAALRIVQPAKLVPDSPPEMTDDQIRELHATDPLAAMAALTERANKRIEANLNARLQPLSRSGADIAEQNARSKYTTEFELFGDQIHAQLAKVPDRSLMSSAAVWDDLISYVRGQPGNVDKLIEHKLAKTKKDAELAAFEAADAGAGASLTGTTQRASIQRAAPVADETKREICKVLGMAVADYDKWSKLG